MSRQLLGIVFFVAVAGLFVVYVFTSNFKPSLATIPLIYSLRGRESNRKGNFINATNWTRGQENNGTRNVNATNHGNSNRHRVILVYTSFFGSFPWEGVETTQKFTQFKGEPCPVRNCVVTYDRKNISSSDVVLFHARDLPDHNTLVELHKNRAPNQAWVFYIIESPPHTPDTSAFNGMFNWTMTYRRDSDIRHPYGFYAPLKASDPTPLPSKDYSQGRDKLVVWTVSNCGGLRKNYVDKLKQHIQVDIYGGCGSSGCSSNAGISSSQCNDLLRTYKFQLAFENTNCLDYVTEKYWGSPLELGIVPIVLGGADYKEIAIPGSYINVLDFPSPKALADHLLYLDKNNTAYNEYFQWKTKYKLGGVLHGNNLSRHYPWMCELCAVANNRSIGTKVYENLGEFWGRQHCGLHDSDFQRIMSQ